VFLLVFKIQKVVTTFFAVFRTFSRTMMASIYWLQTAGSKGKDGYVKPKDWEGW